MWLLLFPIGWLACGYISIAMIDGWFEHKYPQFQSRTETLATGLMGLGGPITLVASIFFCAAEREGFWFNWRWLIGPRKTHPYRYPDTWLRGMRWQLFTMAGLLIGAIGNGFAGRGWLFALDAACLVMCAVINKHAWEKRGDVIAAEKARKVVPQVFHGIGGGLGGGGNGGGGIYSGTVTNLYGNGMSTSQTTSSGVIVGDRARRHPDYPSTFGWRAWTFDPQTKLLYSPSMGTPWHGSELRVETWDEQHVVRGVAGIHAHFVPPNWEKQNTGYYSTYHPSGQVSSSVMIPPPSLVGSSIINFSIGMTAYTFHATPDGNWQDTRTGTIYPAGKTISLGDDQPRPVTISGIVERFGKYVMGTEGWRAEWAIIRKLVAPNTEIGLALEKSYPDVEVIYPKEEQTDGHR